MFYFYCSEWDEIDAQRFSSVFMRVFVQMGLDRFFDRRILKTLTSEAVSG
jgi:hypothetical protein